MSLAIRVFAILGAFLPLTFMTKNAEAQCTRDAECKGDRICLDGRCVELSEARRLSEMAAQPTAGLQPTTPFTQEPAPGQQGPASGFQQVNPAVQSQQPTSQSAYSDWYEHLYVHLAANLGIHGRGEMNVDGSKPNITGKTRFGSHLSFYGVVDPRFHLGAYFDYGRGDVTIGSENSIHSNQYGFGITFKAGGKVSDRAWLGFHGSLGMNVVDFSDADAWKGVELSPRIHLDVLTTEPSASKIGAFVALGPNIIAKTYGRTPDGYGKAAMVYLNLLLGIAFGS